MERPAERRDREAEIRAIVDTGRRTRAATPRWLWLMAGIVAAVCLVGFVAILIADPAPAATAVPRPGASGSGGSGLGHGLVLGAAVGVVIGIAVARQRAAHSSRSSP